MYLVFLDTFQIILQECQKYIFEKSSCIVAVTRSHLWVLSEGTSCDASSAVRSVKCPMCLERRWRLSPTDEHTAKQAGQLCTCVDLERNGWSPRFSAAGGLTLGIGYRWLVGTGGLFLAMKLMRLHSELVPEDPEHHLRAFWITWGVAQGLQL